MRGHRLRPLVVVLAVAGLSVTAVGRAEAELVVLTNGRTLSVSGYAVAGDAITLSLRAGGTMSLSRTLVDHVDADEVAYPPPAGAGAVVPLAPIPGSSASLAGKPYAAMIGTVASAYGLDAKLVHAVVEAESNYQARARSPKGARGLMQLMPDTAKQYGVTDPYDPQSNLDAGVRHLKDLLSRLDLRLALAAYNAGEAMVRRYDGMPPFPETRSYVQRILARVGR